MSTKAFDSVRQEFALLCGSLVYERGKERERVALEEFDALCADSRVAQIAIGGEHRPELVYIATNRLIMVGPDGEPRALGEFLITLRPHEGSFYKRVSTENVTGAYKWGSYLVHHPHVYIEEKNPCFGEARLKMLAWFADGKLGHVALFTMNFLETARPDRNVISYDLWPLLEGEERIAWKRIHSHIQPYPTKT